MKILNQVLTYTYPVELILCKPTTFFINKKKKTIERLGLFVQDLKWVPHADRYTHFSRLIRINSIHVYGYMTLATDTPDMSKTFVSSGSLYYYGYGSSTVYMFLTVGNRKDILQAQGEVGTELGDHGL